MQTNIYQFLHSTRILNIKEILQKCFHTRIRNFSNIFKKPYHINMYRQLQSQPCQRMTQLPFSAVSDYSVHQPPNLALYFTSTYNYVLPLRIKTALHSYNNLSDQRFSYHTCINNLPKNAYLQPPKDSYIPKITKISTTKYAQHSFQSVVMKPNSCFQDNGPPNQHTCCHATPTLLH